MALTLTCPCKATLRLTEPFPMPGSQVKCQACGRDIAVSYPDGVITQLRQAGKRFAVTPVPTVSRGASPAPKVPQAPPPPPPGGTPTTFPTEIDRTQVDPTMVADEISGPPVLHEIDRTIPAMVNPYGAHPVLPPDADLASDDYEVNLATEAYTSPNPGGDDTALGLTHAGPATEPTASPAASLGSASPVASLGSASPAAEGSRAPTPPVSPPKKKRGKLLGCVSAAGTLGLGAVVLTLLAGGGAAAGGYWYYSQDLPTFETLKAYKPPTVTVVYDKDGDMLGEIYDQRRYVVPLERIPKHVQNAFISAEDANFWHHGGVDYIGILRAVGRNLRQGRMAQGASTITQQVTRNFLLSNDKKLERKIKEAILAQRIEGIFSKEHILFLYLNQIYLGSHAYGVEAASRVYFGKHVEDITVAEAAILAGLPQRPSDYSPHHSWDQARGRQKYVIGQMQAKGYLTQAEADAALKEDVKIVRRDNPFLETAPHFTEYARRYLVEKYGKERVLNEGLEVWTTCDLDLQQLAQRSVTKQVYRVDQRTGFRREKVEHLSGAAIQKRRDAHELAMRKAWSRKQDPAGRVPLPKASKLSVGEVYDAVVLEVKPKWSRIGIGSHEAIVPIGWSRWLYAPNPKRSWKNRRQTDLTALEDNDGDWKKDAAILQAGDVVLVKVEALSTRDGKNTKLFKSTPGASKAFVAARMWQDPEVEAAMMSFDLHTGAVRAMVGGADFKKSQLNRVIQSKRQVGSTFKPIVYSAAIRSRKITAATLVPDAPLAYATDSEFIWKPGNYGSDFLGNITVRRALQMSRNTATVRILDSVDPGMNDDIVYQFARTLGIGGPPLYTLGDDFVATPQNSKLCPWVRETRESTICMDHYPARTDPKMSNTRHRRALTDADEHWCRACDLSMGLGSVSLSMEELMRAYTAFATSGTLVQPYYIEKVQDRDGNVLEQHQKVEFPQVIEPEVSSIARWLLNGVYRGGTGYQAFKALKLEGMGGKTGTTNDYKDAWFIGFSNDVITSAWVGYDQPRSMGFSSTGGRTALPIWIDYMRVAAPKDKDRAFRMEGAIEWASIDEKTGRRVRSGGRKYPFLRGTTPESSGISAGQVTVDDITEL